MKDPLVEMADKLRVKGGIEWRQAILADSRVEFFRGKDFAAHYRDNTENMGPYVPKGILQHSLALHKNDASTFSTISQFAFLCMILNQHARPRFK